MNGGEIENPDAELARMGHIEDFRFRHIYEAADRVEEIVETDQSVADVIGVLCERRGLKWSIGKMYLTKE
jgi:hypothetical protein